MKQWIKGMDLSSLAEVEQCGGRFYDNGKNDNAMNILKRYGMNLVRLRLWNDPFSEDGTAYGGGGNDLTTTLSLARRARDSKTGWLLDFHYSDFWADPGKQTCPKAWQGMDAAQLTTAVYQYTAQVLEICKKEGLLPQIVSIGNEVSNGLLWPLGKVPAYDNITRFISAGIQALRDTAPGIPAMIHLDNGGNNKLYRTWFDNYLEHNGADFEYIGLSYYPFWHGTPAMLRDNMYDIALRYHKDLILAEVSTAHTMADYQNFEKLSADKRKGMAASPRLAASVPYPMTPEGQAKFLQDILQIVHDIPQNRGAGIIYWEPAWLPVPGSQWATPPAVRYMQEKGPGGNEWANQALFDYHGNALPGLTVIRDFKI